MVALLDVNVLIALFDGMHEHHEKAHHWFGRHRRLGWATCPLTENGFVRIISNSSYPGRGTTLPDAVFRLEEFRETGYHRFWPDAISVRNEELFSTQHITSPKRLTDVTSWPSRATMEAGWRPLTVAFRCNPCPALDQNIWLFLGAELRTATCHPEGERGILGEGGPLPE